MLPDSLSLTAAALLVLGAQQQIDPYDVLLDPSAPSWFEAAPREARIAVDTSKGRFVIAIHRDWAPVGADRFYALARAGYYDDSRFFRVRAGYITQFGIAGRPEVARLWREKTIPDDPVRASNRRGTLGFAMTGPDTRSTQVYINLADNPQLDDGGFAPIGEVVEGMEVVDALYAGYDEGAGGGMRGGRQDLLFEGGSAYLDKSFPKLDRLVRASVLAGN